MTDHADQIRRAFQSHEHLAPDSLVVLARAEELARTYRRRRVGAQVAGGAVLGATLIAGGLGLPGLLGGNGPRSTVIVQAPAGDTATTAAATPTVPTPKVTTPKPSSPEYARDTDAYFAAGYDVTDAEKLARIWGLSADSKNLSNVKAEAGRRLLAGEKLPVAVDPAAAAELKKQKASETFFAAGYSITDAERLADLWHTSTVFEAKVLGGQKLLAGQELPFAP